MIYGCGSGSKKALRQPRRLTGSLTTKGSLLKRIEAAVLKTVLYADVFDFPMTAAEIHHFLIHNEPTTAEQIRELLATSPLLQQTLESADGYIVCAGRSSLIPIRIAREQSSHKLWAQALTCGTWLSRLPFVRMVALTGALAMRNAADDDDDLDFILVTSARRVWLARAFSIVLVRLGRLRGVEICPNYVLAEDALRQEREDMYMAHEVAQMVPIYGQPLYRRMRRLNEWVTRYMPNASGAFYPEDERAIGPAWAVFKQALESLLGGRIGDTLEGWEYRRKVRRFAGDMQKPHSAAQLDEGHVKGHFDDYGHPVLKKYQDRLRKYGLLDQTPQMPMVIAGD